MVKFDDNDSVNLSDENISPYFSIPIWLSALRMALVFSGVYIAILSIIIAFKSSFGYQFTFDLNTPALLIALAIGKRYLSKKQGRFVRVDEFVVSSIASSITVVAVQLIPVFLYFDVKTIPFRSFMGVFFIIFMHVLIVFLVLFPWRRLFAGCLFDK